MTGHHGRRPSDRVATAATQRVGFLVRGQVQGIGFRPAVHRVACRHGVHGFVANDLSGVRIEAEGPADVVRAFVEEIGAMACATGGYAEDAIPLPPRSDRKFVIAPSARAGAVQLSLSPDTGLCEACALELQDGLDRRHGYALSTCARCGPRFSIAEAAPFDRPHTTMMAFPPCATCLEEYASPSNRRFHAQTVCCPVCGPRLTFVDAGGARCGVREGEPDTGPLERALERLEGGGVVAIKGVGGFHLVCDATCDRAVARVREVKRRPEQPLAVMVRDLEAARTFARVTDDEERLLCSPAAPVVLLARRPQTALAEGVCAASPLVGVLLPYTPLHALVLAHLTVPLVVTSANRSGAPIEADPGAESRLQAMCDGVLSHNRRIHNRCDDSVARVVAGRPRILRRARGYVPASLPLPQPLARPVLALGGQLKATFALGSGRSVYPGPYVGDLGSPAVLDAYEAALARFVALTGWKPEVVAHDAHPDYATTALARKLARTEGLRAVAVQHHHAHMASAMVEHGLLQRVIGVIFDGSGFGTDGTLWGGEFLLGDLASVRRVGHFRPVRLPGGEAAIRAPVRSAIAYLLDAGIDPGGLFASTDTAQLDTAQLAVLARMIETGVNAPVSSACGRLFDAIAAMVGFAKRCSYEGQAAIELEALAMAASHERPCEAYPFVLHEGLPGTWVLDFRPMIRAIHGALGRATPAQIAARFHATLACAVEHQCRAIRNATGVDRVVLGGGVFANGILLTNCQERLGANGFRVYAHARLPPGDGGLCVGQLAVAATA